MDHSWRLRPPPIQGNICPTCSVSHFPFCPPPHPSFNQNPRFQSHNGQFFQRPPFDPFLDHRGPTVNLHRPFVGNPSDGFGDPRPWHRSPSLDPYGQFHGQSEVGDSVMANGVYWDGFAPPSYDHGSVGFKRMRVDELASGSFTSGNHVNSSIISAENERRLKLIRDHGGALSGLPQGGANMVLGFNHETKGYIRESSGFDSGFGDIDGREHVKFDNSGEGRNDMTLKPPRDFDMNDFRDPGFSNFDRKAMSFHPEPGFNLYSYKEEHGLVLGQQDSQNNRNEELEQSQYSQVENSLHQSLHNNGHNSHSTGRFTNVEQTQQSQNVAAPYYGGMHSNANTGDHYLSVSQKGDLNQLSHMSQNVPCPISEAPNEHHRNRNLQQFHHSDSMSEKEPHYTRPPNWQGMSGSSTPFHDQSSFSMENRNLNNQLPQSYAMEDRPLSKHDFCVPGQLSNMRQSFGVNVPSQDGIQGPVGQQNFAVPSQYGPQHLNKQAGYVSISTGTKMGLTQASCVFNVQPPLPASPPPPLPVDPPGHPLSEPLSSSSPPKTLCSLFPIPVSSSVTVPSSYSSVPEVCSLAQAYYPNKPHLHASTGFATEEFQSRQALSKKYMGEGQSFPLRHLSSDKPKVVDASHIFKQPHRATRPNHIVVILRGLPGSGKSYLAKMMRDLEVENGGDVPRIHSMDDYFMTEVEKDETEVSKSSVRRKKSVMKKVMEYCYEPEMEEAYRSSMLKAFKKTLDEGDFSFIIVDDRNLRVADFAQFWATAKRSGYEVYLLEATYKDPVGCAARNVHGFTQDDIQKMAEQWEEAPPLYLKLDIKSLLHGDHLEQSGIQEVDMDTEDGDPAGGLSVSEERNPENVIGPPVGEFAPDGPSNDDKRWDAEGDHPVEQVKELGRSKWSDDLDEIDAQRTEAMKGNLSALSGLIQAYGKEGKSVHWGDQVGNTGFSIGAAKKANMLSLVIGPGAGYNLKSNSLPEEQNLTSIGNSGDSKRQNIFQEQIRAERESFRAVFDKRRQRIRGLDVEEE